MKLSIVVLALASLLIAVPASAQDRVVDNAGAPCLSGRPVHPTISAAVAAASPGQTILVCAGTYFENVIVNKADLTLQGQGAARLGPGIATVPGIEVVVNGVTIRGFDISGFGDACGVQVAADRGDITDNRVHANAFGICVSGGSDHRVRYNVVQNNSIGVLVENTTGPVDVSNNTVKNNGLGGIEASQCLVPGVVIDHNSVTGSRPGIVSRCRDVVISNNTVRGPGASTPDSFGLFTSGASGVFTRNLFRDFETGMFLDGCNGCTASFNSIGFNGVGLDLLNSTGTTVARNNVSRSTTVDCRWDGSGVNVLTNNNCGSQDPPGAFD